MEHNIVATMVAELSSGLYLPLEWDNVEVKSDLHGN